MKTKKVNRYYCDYCKKSGGSARHMRTHEKHCTMNPGRTCGVCGLLEETQASMGNLLAVLPKVGSECLSEYGTPYMSYNDEDTKAIHKALVELRDIANNCPVCIMAAIRQSGIPVPMVTDFNFTDEMKEVWAEFNARQLRETDTFERAQLH